MKSTNNPEIQTENQKSKAPHEITIQKTNSTQTPTQKKNMQNRRRAEEAIKGLASPRGLRLLEAEEHSPQGRPEGGAHPRGRRRGEELPALGLVGEPPVGRAGGRAGGC